MAEKPRPVGMPDAPMGDGWRFYAAVREFVLRARGELGARGQRFLTEDELVATGLFKVQSGKLVAASPVPQAPTGPVGVVGSLEDGLPTVRWDAPVYSGHARTEIWTGTRVDVSGARRAGVIDAQAAPVYTDRTGSTGLRYWVRHVNSAGVAGPFHARNGLAIGQG